MKGLAATGVFLAQGVLLAAGVAMAANGKGIAVLIVALFAVVAGQGPLTLFDGGAP